MKFPLPCGSRRTLKNTGQQALHLYKYLIKNVDFILRHCFKVFYEVGNKLKPCFENNIVELVSTYISISKNIYQDGQSGRGGG